MTPWEYRRNAPTRRGIIQAMPERPPAPSPSLFTLPAIDSVFTLADAPAAFERCQASGKRGKVVLRAVNEVADA